MGVMESMKRGYRSVMKDPAKHAKNIGSNVASQGAKAGKAAEATVKGAGNVATRGTGLGPARGLRDVLMEAKRKISGS